MEISAALILILVLVLVFAGVRFAAKSRRKKLLLQRERQRRRKPTYKPRPMSSRGEMRAYDDPSTLAEDITTMGTAPTTTHNPRGTVSATARPTSTAAGTKPGTGGK
jgi:hypothetical protein